MEGNTQEPQVSPKMPDGEGEQDVGIAKRLTKKLIKQNTRILIKEIQVLKRYANEDLLMNFEEDLYKGWDYYERQYFNEDDYKSHIIEVTGYFDYSELKDEIDEYIKQKVYYQALLEYIRVYGEDYE